MQVRDRVKKCVLLLVCGGVVSFAASGKRTPIFASSENNKLAQTGTKDAKLLERKRMLTECVELQKRLDQAGLRILDTRPKTDYDKAHIPGAVWVDVAAWQKLTKSNGGLRNAQAWNGEVSRVGISNGTRVVMYGSRLPDVGRVWWTLKYLGNENATILNGGWELWLKEGRPTTTAIPEVTAGRFEARFQADRLEEIDTLKDALRSGKIKVVDTRSADEFTGKEVQGKQAGHISGAMHLEWKELIAKDGRFKTQDELRELFRKRGILPDDTAVCY